MKQLVNFHACTKILCTFFKIPYFWGIGEKNYIVILHIVFQFYAVRSIVLKTKEKQGKPCEAERAGKQNNY
jgi:hypothetical protein